MTGIRAGSTSTSVSSARADDVRLLFLVTDVLIGSFRPQLLAIDDRLGEIQLGMLHGVSPKVHDELVKILGILPDAIQEPGWYAHDLEDIADMTCKPRSGSSSCWACC